MNYKPVSLFMSLIFLIWTSHLQAQCSTHLNHSGTGCLGDTITVVDSGIATIQWLKGDSVIKKLVARKAALYGSTVAGNKNDTSGGDSLKLSAPSGVWLDAYGNVFVADYSNNRVQKWAPGANQGVTVAGQKNGASGSDSFHLNGPAGVFVDDSDNVYVVDAFNARVQLWQPGAKYGITVAGQKDGTWGYDSAHLYFPNAVFVDKYKNVYIADYNRVQKWAPHSKFGVTVAGRKNGVAGHDSTYLSTPTGVFVDDSANVYVSDADNNRVSVWPKGSKYGICVAGWKYDTTLGGHDSARLSNPYGVYVDGLGRVYAADANNNRIQRWDPGAKYGITVAGKKNNASGGDSAHLTYALAVYVSMGYDVYVADAGNNRIQKWQQHIYPTWIKPDSAGAYKAIVRFKAGCIDTLATDSIKKCSTYTNYVSGLNVPCHIYPNPSNGVFNITGYLNITVTRTTITLYDMVGRPIESKTLDIHNGYLNTSCGNNTLPAGVYTLQLTAGNSVQSFRVSVVR